MNVTEMRKILNEQREAKKQFAVILDEIKSNEMYSDAYKAQQKAEAEEKYNSEVLKRGAEMAKALQEYKSHIQRGFNLDDTAFTNYLQIVSTLGKDTPKELVDNILNKYKDNAEALKVIKDVSKANNLYVPAGDFIVDDELLDSAINEATNNFGHASSLSAVGIAIYTMEKAEGISEEPTAVLSGNIPTVF